MWVIKCLCELTNTTDKNTMLSLYLWSFIQAPDYTINPVSLYLYHNTCINIHISLYLYYYTSTIIKVLLCRHIYGSQFYQYLYTSTIIHKCKHVFVALETMPSTNSAKAGCALVSHTVLSVSECDYGLGILTLSLSHHDTGKCIHDASITIVLGCTLDSQSTNSTKRIGYPH